MLKLLEKNQFQNVRVSITVPNTSESILPEAKEYFLIYKKRVHTFFLELLNRNIIPFYDCNKLPFCFLTEEEKQQYVQFESIMDTQPYDKSDIRSEVVQCSPVIDILQDLTAVRCFGLSQSTKVKISDFENLTDLKNYYRWSIDDLAYHREIMPECKNCYEYKTKKCMGGCIVFKLNKILALRQMINQNNV